MTGCREGSAEAPADRVRCRSRRKTAGEYCGCRAKAGVTGQAHRVATAVALAAIYANDPATAAWDLGVTLRKARRDKLIEARPICEKANPLARQPQSGVATIAR